MTHGRRHLAERTGPGPRESGRFRRRGGREVLCSCGAACDVDAWLGLPLVGQIRFFDENDDGPLLFLSTAAVRRCPGCDRGLVSPGPAWP